MPLTRTLLTLSLGMALLQNPVFATPTLSSAGRDNQVTARDNNAWVEINKAAFESNIRALQDALADTSKLCAVLKADAYGHGLGLLMPSVIATSVPCVAVASNEEVRIVRKSGFKGQLIRVRTATLEELQAALPYSVEELVGNLDYAVQASLIAKNAGRPLVVHLGLNSGGMSRNGLEMTTAKGRSDAIAITQLPNLEVRAIMTHFAVEDVAHVRADLQTFNQQANWLMDVARLERDNITLHAANSFATLEVPESHLDMVRPGGVLFGDTAPTHSQYKRVMQFKSHVASINSYPKSNAVGYDHTYILGRDTKLANIPAGYSDGYRPTPKGSVLIRGHRVPVVGKVSMNTMTVDVTDLPDVRMGDEVVLFGKQGDAEITQADVEESNGTLLADLYTVWGNSNPKLLVEQ